MNTISQDGEWFCLQCNDVVNPIDLTYQERCSLCGSKAQWVFENPIYGSDVYLDIKKRAEKAEAERDELKDNIQHALLKDIMMVYRHVKQGNGDQWTVTDDIKNGRRRSDDNRT